ncbi:MAG TPA: toll/interleukin-1 receptor domain-containing protein [Methanosarcinales archaeon]|nr:toll/interleukin-1 receptor domain-containing protein [Methanosarcinales archaeon]
MPMSKNKTAFLSYAHEDRGFAERIATELRKAGIDVKIDIWEIKPGDSLIQKIFVEGLSNCDTFLILLSNASVRSKWVREELDYAMIKKMDGVTRIIPLIKEKCEIPPPLRTLLWVDLSVDFNDGIRRVVKSIHDVSEKPPLGKIPDYITELKNSVGGLSRAASTVGSILLSPRDDQLGFEKGYTAEEIHHLVSMLTEEEINDAVDELGEYGLVHTRKGIGTAPYNFVSVEPTYALFLHFKEEGMDYDPIEDIKTVASAVASQKSGIDGNGIQELCNLQPVRINRAVAYLEDYGIVRVRKFLGTAPYSFGHVEAIRKTRQFVEENCK